MHDTQIQPVCIAFTQIQVADKGKLAKTMAVAFIAGSITLNDDSDYS